MATEAHFRETGFDVSGLALTITQPEALTTGDWEKVRQLTVEAFSDDLQATRSRTEIDYYLQTGSLDNFIATRVDPNAAVKAGRARAGQLYEDPLVVMVTDGNDLVAFGEVANNVSGKSNLERKIKQATIFKSYATIREQATRPDHRHRGIGHVVTYALLSNCSYIGPTTAYVLSDLPQMEAAAQAIGYHPTGSYEWPLFGKDAEPAQLTRLEARFTAGVLLQLWQQGARKALFHEFGSVRMFSA